MSASGMAASAFATRTSGGSCSGWFRRLQKCSFHRDTTDTRSDSRHPSAAFSGIDGTVLIGLSWQNLAKASLISPLPSRCSLSRAIRSAHCSLSPKCPTPRTSNNMIILAIAIIMAIHAHVTNLNWMCETDAEI